MDIRYSALLILIQTNKEVSYLRYKYIDRWEDRRAEGGEKKDIIFVHLDMMCVQNFIHVSVSIHVFL